MNSRLYRMTEHSHRLKYPMKLVDGKYQRISWDQAIDEITARMTKIREESGPDAAYFIGSSKHSNEQAEWLRKFVSFWGTNNCDHQARICHSTTVAGVANTWGYGAMTNSYNDMVGGGGEESPQFRWADSDRRRRVDDHPVPAVQLAQQGRFHLDDEDRRQLDRA